MGYFRKCLGIVKIIYKAWCFGTFPKIAKVSNAAPVAIQAFGKEHLIWIFFFFFKHHALAFEYGVWPGEVDVLEYTKGRRISLGTGDYVQALDPVFGDLHYFSRLDFTVIPVDRDTGSVHLLYQVLPVSKWHVLKVSLGANGLEAAWLRGDDPAFCVSFSTCWGRWKGCVCVCVSPV